MLVPPPAINLRKAASYNSQDRGPLSSTSSRFNFNHLLFSPPPSPSLPALVPRRKKQPHSPTRILTTRPKRAFRVLFYFVGSILTIYALTTSLRSQNVRPRAEPDLFQPKATEVEMVGQDTLPNFPTPVLLNGSNSKPKWTVSVPPEYDFPLSIQEYSDMMDQCREVSSHAEAAAKKAPISTQTILGFKASKDRFVDVFEAEKNNLLPATTKALAANEAGQFVGVQTNSMFGKPVCQTSMTFVLESTDAGLGNSLMLMWTLYGLAKEQGRAFFVEDSRWAYGRYTDMFQPPPVPNCQPPPRHHIIPCPAQARHLAVTSATAKELFPIFFSEHRRIGGSADELRDQFELARTGYRSFFSLTERDQDYVDSRVKKIRTQAKPGQAESRAAPVIGLHIRRGDRHPLEPQYQGTYVPLDEFSAASERLVEAYYNGTDKAPSDRRAITLLASDDPTVHKNTELSRATPAQERIQLASKDAIKKAGDDPILLRQFVDETFGWEGGFYAPMFWNLGVDRRNNAANAPSGVKVENVNEEARLMAPPSEQTLKLRSLMGRAYMLDLAVLADASDTVVCTVSAMGCRLLAVMKGWEDSVEGEGWVNIDGDYGWMGIRW
ncbi:hypothetical protein HJFPF1_01025 [Paramyrothecium foliicola]|nr:hypothetical protein HJFPF1_01025 [Paramyrothecium foliicola]